MKAVYRFCFSADVLVEGLHRWRTLQMATWALWLHRLTMILICVVVTSIAFNGQRPWVALLVWIVVGYLLLKPWIDDLQTRRQFKLSPYQNENITICLTDDGYHAVGEVSNTSFGWNAFTRAVRFTDGFLLLQGPNVFNWLRNEALAEGKVDEVELLLRKHIANFTVQ